MSPAVLEPPITKDQSPRTNHLIIHTDGGSRGNPGPAATGIVILDGLTHTLIHQFGRCLGVATNNEAEYSAVLHALEWLLSQPPIPNPQSPMTITFKLDSKLVVEQLNGHWKINNLNLRDHNSKILSLISKNQLKVDFMYIPRAQNSAADTQVNLALDANLANNQ